MAPPWTLGYSLQQLKRIADTFRKSAQGVVFSQFAIPSEADVARALKDGHIKQNGDSVAIIRKVHSKSYVTDFAQRRIPHLPGDLVIKEIAGSPAGMRQLLIDLAKEHGSGRPIVVHGHVERPQLRAVLRDIGFRVVAVQVGAASDMRAVWLRDRQPQIPSPLHAADAIALGIINKTFATRTNIAAIRSEIERANIEWHQHYSAYNKRRAWTAVALRGFGGKVHLIEKPSEMAKSWQKLHPERMMQNATDTPLMARCPTIRRLLARIPGTKERVRLMRLAPGGGELARHSDVTDRNAGLRDGMIVRLHLPIRTSPKCIFQSWDLNGTRHTKHFHEGCLFYLDVRKPHRVYNESDTDRIHLVVDTVATEALRKLIAHAS